MYKTWLTSWLVIPLFTILSCSPGQAQDATKSQPIAPAVRLTNADSSVSIPRDGSKLPATAQPIFFSAHRAMDWLKLANKPDGRFVYGFLPALRVPMEGDNFQSQAG